MHDNTARLGSESDASGPLLHGPPPSGDAIEVRAMSRADLPEVLSLLRRALGPESRAGNPAYWDWKHEQNPFGSSPCLVAEAEGKIVGLRVFLRWELQWRGRTVRAVRAVDTATDSKWRRRGIFSRLTLGLLDECEKEGVGLVFNTPNDRSRPGYLKMGWGIVGRPPLLVRARRPLRIAKAMVRHTAQASTDGGPMQGFPTVADLLESVDVQRFIGSDGQPPLVGGGQGRADSAPLMTCSSPGYLAWRYRDVPGVSYSASWDQRQAGAALIFSLKERAGLRELSIAETLVASERDIGSAARLIRDVWRQSDADYGLAVASADTAARRALRRALFFAVPGRGPMLCARPLSAGPSAAELLDLRNWRVSLGDLELF
ncbi:MAG: GNAT family N-acetyltransferase [Acidobacteriota bacterium]|jgi:GNAT superfamily N-acetyltransferase